MTKEQEERHDRIWEEYTLLSQEERAELPFYLLGYFYPDIWSGDDLMASEKILIAIQNFLERKKNKSCDQE